MRTHVGTLPVEITRPESAKFHHPLLLLHGLWTGAWIWQPFATYLAHRGWESWAPSFVPALAGDPRDALARVIAVMPASPVIVAHDVGVLAAAEAVRDETPALVAIAPLVSPAESGGRGIFAWPRFWRARLGGARVAPPAGAAAAAFLGAALAARDRLMDDSGPRFRTIAAGALRLPASLPLPGLVVGGARDAVVSPLVVAAVAARYSWEHRVYPDRGHFPMLEPRWEAVADDVHRWIVRTIGAELLAFLDDDDVPGPL